MYRRQHSAIQFLFVALGAFVLLSVPSVSGGRLSKPWLEIQRVQGADLFPGSAFGFSVALDGGRALVGAPAISFGPGAAYVFVRQGDVWIEEQKLVASDGPPGGDARFGYSVAFEGDTALVGAYLADVDGNTHQGAAYVYERIGGMWIEQQKLTASDGLKQDRFGAAVALEGDTLMISAPSDDIGANLGQGSVYVFGRVGGTWIQQQKIVISDGQPNDLLGRYDVVIDGDRAVIGAPSATVDGVNNKGAVYVLAREAGVWIEEARLTPADVSLPISFGDSVDLDGSRVVAGAPGETVTHDTQGTAYIFNKVGESWVEGQRLVASDAGELGLFGGRATATRGGRILVHGKFDSPGHPSQGAVYSFRWDSDAGEWVEEQKITASDGVGLNQFGEAIALDSDMPLIGAASGTGGGAAYSFRRATLFADGFESGDTSAWSNTVP